LRAGRKWKGILCQKIVDAKERKTPGEKESPALFSVARGRGKEKRDKRPFTSRKEGKAFFTKWKAGA